jgi:4-amino-4-deoxy-L-arabinose transferase-like glycosyltransferase
LIWLKVGLSHPAFYNDVVDREFLSRFQSGSRDDERAQPLWFYFPHLLQKFAPWSLLLLAFACCFPQVRRGLRDRPPLLWLVLWSMGGLLLMTFIPAKRVDRIFPVIPPLCLLVVEWCALLWSDRRVRIAAGASMLAGIVFSGGYFIGLIPIGYRDHTTSLVDFAQKARALATAHGVTQITLPRARDEGLLLYFDEIDFAGKSDAFNVWKSGGPAALVLSDRTTETFRKEVGPVAPALDSGVLKDKNEKRYYLFLRP